MENDRGKLFRFFFSGKTKSSEKLMLVESDKIFTKDAENAESLNIFFLNTVKNRRSAGCKEVNPLLKSYMCDIETNF